MSAMDIKYNLELLTFSLNQLKIMRGEILNLYVERDMWKQKYEAEVAKNPPRNPLKRSREPDDEIKNNADGEDTNMTS